MACGIQEKWESGGAEAGRIYYLSNSSERLGSDAEFCQSLLGSIIDRGDVIGYSGQLGDNAHSAFRFKVRSDDRNPLTEAGGPYLHWVQPSVFFSWQCFDARRCSSPVCCPTRSKVISSPDRAANSIAANPPDCEAAKWRRV